MEGINQIKTTNITVDDLDGVVLSRENVPQSESEIRLQLELREQLKKPLIGKKLQFTEEQLITFQNSLNEIE